MADARGRHPFRKGLCARSIGTIEGKNAALISPQSMPSSDDLEVNVVVMRANRRQSGVRTAANAFRDQGVYMEASFVETKSQLGTPLAGTEHDIAESFSIGSQRDQLVVRLQHLPVHSCLLLLVRECPRAQPRRRMAGS